MPTVKICNPYAIFILRRQINLAVRLLCGVSVKRTMCGLLHYSILILYVLYVKQTYVCCSIARMQIFAPSTFYPLLKIGLKANIWIVTSVNLWQIDTQIQYIVGDTHFGCNFQYLFIRIRRLHHIVSGCKLSLSTPKAMVAMKF